MNSMFGGSSSRTGSALRGGGSGIEGYKMKAPKGQRAYALPNFTPEQFQLFDQSMQQAGPDSYLGQLAGGDEGIFNEIEAPGYQAFSGTLGNIASRFSAGGGQGSLSGRRSSGFQNATTSAASNFAQQLQAQRHQLRSGAISSLHDMSQNLLNQRPYEQMFANKQKKQSGWGGLIGGGLGAAGGFLAGGPAGALQGAQMGYGIGSSF